VQGGVAGARRAAAPALGLLVALLTWRDVNFRPVDSLDPSWQAALHMVAHRHMHALIFTYGPLGFLGQGVGYYRWTVVLAALYLVTVTAALATALIAVLRRDVGLPAAAVAAFVLVSATRDLGVTDQVVVAVTIAAFGVLRGDHSERAERILVAVAGVVAGTHLLVKFNVGVTVALVGAVVAWSAGRRGWRSEATFAGAALGSLLAGWVLTGNGLTGLAPFLSRSMQVASGYSEAMGIEANGRGGYLALAGGVSVLLLVLGWAATRGWPAARRRALAAGGVLWLYAAFKLGFVRHDSHDVVFFGEALVIGAVFAGAAARRPSPTVVWTWIRRGLAGAGTVVLLVALLVTSKLAVPTILNPGPALGRLGGDLPVLVSPGAAAREIAKGRANLQRRYYALSPAVLAALRGHTVHIHPWEAGIAWAYPEIRWRPLPVFQEYTAYTADLDHLNADYLSGPNAPERILTQEISIDIRNPDWESPAAVVAIACHYRQLVTEPKWQVLERVPNRCGAPTTLAVVHARTGDNIAVPDTPGKDVLVVARISGLDHSLFYRLRSTLWRAAQVHVSLNGRRRWRVVPGTAPDGLLVRAPMERLGFSQPFAPESATFLRVTQPDGFGLSSHLSIEFVAVPVTG
jgi:hypothetical protein